MSDDKKNLKDLKNRLQIKKREVKKPKPEPVVKAAPREKKPSRDDFALPFKKQDRPDLDPIGDVSEDEFAEMEKAHKKGMGLKGIIRILATLLMLFFALAFGYYFGKTFKSRELENIKVDEAKFIQNKIEKKFTKKDKKVLEAFAEFKAEVEGFMEKLKTAKGKGKNLMDLKPMLLEFLTVCEDFHDNGTTILPGEVFSGAVYNFDLVKTGVPFILRLNEVWLLTRQAKMLKGKLMAIDKPDIKFQLDIALKKVSTKIKPVVDGKPGTEEFEVTGLEGTLVKAFPAQENPNWPKATPKQQKTMPRWLVPYKEMSKKDAEVKAALPDEIVKLEVGRVIYNIQIKYINVLLDDITNHVYYLNDVVTNVNYSKFQKALKGFSGKDKYFTF